MSSKLPQPTAPILDEQCNIVLYHASQLAGRVYTFLDASIGSPQQNKAAKDCVRRYFQEFYDEIWMRSESGKRGVAPIYPTEQHPNR